MVFAKRVVGFFCIFFVIVALVAVPFILFDSIYFNTGLRIDAELAAKFGDFFGGFVGTVFSITSTLLLIYTLLAQYIESSKNSTRDRFFKMLDFHNDNVRGLRIPSLETAKLNFIEEGRRAFVVYKIQLKRLLESVSEVNSVLNANLTDAQKIDIAYICFYYGQSDTWINFIKEKISLHPCGDVVAQMMLDKVNACPGLKLGRTNQTELSSYFRNMYNAIKIVDGDKFLTEKEKSDLIKIYRAQISNPELYVLFFNLVSRFGKKWIERAYIERYGVLTNLPRSYCDGYDPSVFFDIQFEEDEIGPWVR